MKDNRKKTPPLPLADLWLHTNAVYVQGGRGAGKVIAAKQYVLRFFKNFKKRK
jgi:hypothetical protein